MSGKINKILQKKIISNDIMVQIHIARWFVKGGWIKKGRVEKKGWGEGATILIHTYLMRHV